MRYKDPSLNYSLTNCLKSSREEWIQPVVKTSCPQPGDAFFNGRMGAEEIEQTASRQRVDDKHEVQGDIHDKKCQGEKKWV